MLALWKGLPHGSKSLSGAVKPSGDTQRPGSQNHHTTSPVDSASSHSGSVIVSCATSSSNPALKAPCTSSFAAALKKLAKQAVDPVTTVSSVSSVSTPLPPHQSVTPKHHSLTSGQSSKSAIPSVPVSITPVLNYVNHSVESRNKDAEFSRYSQGGRTSMNLMEPVSLKMDQSSPKTIKSGLYNIKREEMYYENNDTGRRPPSSHQRPEVGRDSEESHASSSGFQLYRNFDRARNSISSYEHAMPYPYQPTFLPPPPSFSHQTYRLEDATYVDHYGMLRNTTTHIPSSSASVLPFVARSPYPPEILGQSIRVASPSGLFTIHERAKYAENRGQELFRHSSRELTSQVIQSPLPVTLSRNSESPGHPGSITYGTPREHSNKHSSPPVAASSTPLNLVRCSNQNTNKWDSHHQIVSQCSQAKSPQEELGFNHSIYLQQELQQPLAMTGRRPVMSELQSIFRDKNYNKNHSISQRRQGPISPTMDVSYSRSSSLPSSSHPIHSERLMLKPTTYSSRLEPLDRLTLLNQERKSVISADNSPHSQAEMCKTGAVPPRVLTPHKSNFSSTLSEPKSTLGEIITNLTVNKAQTMFENHLDTSVLKTEAIGRDLTQQVIPNVQVQKAGCNTQAAITGCTSQWSGLVSKLDLEWEKLQKARLAGKCGDSDDEVESENEENCLKEILIITKGPPLSLDLSPKKLEFLDTVGLTTHQKKQELEFAKYLQGRKVLQERPVFPLDSNNTSRECSPLPLTTNITSEELCFAADFPHKVKFLQFLALKLTTFQEKIEIERKWKVTEEGRVRQKQKLKSKCQKKAKVRDRKPEITSLERLPMRSKKRRLQPSPNHLNEASAQEDYNPPLKITAATKLHVSFSNLQTSEQDVHSAVSAIPRYSNPSPGQDSDSKSQKVVSVHKTSGKKPEKLAKDFVQEFHKSVLETTQQQLAGQNRQWSAKKRTGISSPPTLDFPEMISYREKAEKYHWPGIEVIMEVYENYLREQKQEQEFLVERCHYLQRKNQDANNNAERLHYQMTELLQLKYRLDEERHSHQAAIDYLKRTLQLMR